MSDLIAVLFWLSVMNFALLLFWFLMFLFSRDWLYDLHRSVFGITKEEFYVVHYAGMALYEILIMALNVFPYLALRIVVG